MILIYSVFTFSYCSGQDILGGNVAKNYIDSIETPAQIESLLVKIGGEKYKDFKINTTPCIDKECQMLCDSFKVKPWYKIDFDANGYTDILLVGRNNNSNSTICVFGKENNRYEINTITRENFETCSFAVMKTVKGKPEFDFYYFKSDYDSGKTYPPKTLHKATLVYDYGDFMEKNDNIYQHKIEKIEFSGNSNGWNSTGLNITINGDGSAIWQRKEGGFHLLNGKIIEAGTFSTKIVLFNFSYIIQLLNFIDFVNLERFYIVPWTDA
ncbi:MAG: hypothetical protein ABUL44_04235, partial [Flavobacterium sp.]